MTAENQSFVKAAPANVRSAFKGLVAGVHGLQTALKNAKSLTSLESSFSAFGGGPAFIKDDNVVEKWATGICGSSINKSDSVTASVSGP